MKRLTLLFIATAILTATFWAQAPQGTPAAPSAPAADSGKSASKHSRHHHKHHPHKKQAQGQEQPPAT
jgi:hypothetical protein